MDGEPFDAALLGGVVVLLVAVTAVRLSTRAGLPSLLVYLALGIAVGEDGLGLVFEDVELARTLGLTGLIVILLEGGLTTRWATVRPVLPLAASLSTVGVAVSIVVTALAANLLVGLDWQLALLLAAAVSTTDAAAVFSTLRRLPIRPRIVGTLEVESGTNDPLVVILIMTLSLTPDERGSVPAVIALMAYEAVAGAAVGLLAGVVGAAYLRRIALPSSGLYPLTVVGFAVLGYAAAAAVHSSGFLAVYVAALWLGNADLPHRPATLGFVEGLGWVAQIGLFVMLGLLVSPSELAPALLPALVVGSVLLLIARPLSVLVATTPLGVPLREQAFLAWGGLRGAVPIVLAVIPITAGVEGSQRVFDIVFVLVVIFTLVQGPTLAPLARRLGVVERAEPRDVQVDSAPLSDLHADLLQLTIPARSRLAGVQVSELRLPTGAQVTLVVRGGASFVPAPSTLLSTGDSLLVVTTSAVRTAAERRLRAVSRQGKLAGWYGNSRDAQ